MPASEATRLSTMPTVVTNYSYGQLDGTYILPPILYPDGKYYLKLGHHDKFEENLTTSEAIKDWYDQSDYLKGVKTMFSYRSLPLGEPTHLNENVFH